MTRLTISLALLLTGCREYSYSWTVGCSADYVIAVVQLDRRHVAVTCTPIRKESP